jgi:hypothetical protein
VGGREQPDADLVADPGVGYPRLGHLPGSRFFVGWQLGHVHHTQPLLLREVLHLPRDVHKERLSSRIRWPGDATPRG